jgi:hypothetical protein
MSGGRLGPLDDDACDVFTRFEQTLGRGTIGGALRMAGIETG